MIENVMVGDWASYNKDFNPQYVRVTGVSENGEFIQTEETDAYYVKSVYNPIPFTPEIMEKNGFKLNEEESESLSEIYKTKVLAYDFPTILGNRFFIEYNVEEKVAYLTDHTFIAIKYVNEFQHLLRLMERKAPEIKEIVDNFIV
jgi:hypothetical protein